MSGLADRPGRRDRELGCIAQYELRASLSMEAIKALGDEPSPFVQWVTQVVVLLTDTDAALSWFATKSQRFKDYEGREIDGFFYRKVDIEPLPVFGDEGEVVVSHNTYAGSSFVDTYVNVRSGRLFGGVGASAFGEADIRADLIRLAHVLLCRMEALAAQPPATA